LEAIRTGFYIFPFFQTHLSLFSHYDLQLMMLGEQHMTADDITRILNFVEFPAGSKVSQYLEAVLNEMTSEELRIFFHYATNEVAIPVGGLDNPRPSASYDPHKITIQYMPGWTDSRIPVSHVCWYRLDFPNYSNQELLAEKLRAALSNHQLSGGYFDIS
jgi:hypothetical protein